jgi:hypothetical protein
MIAWAISSLVPARCIVLRQSSSALSQSPHKSSIYSTAEDNICSASGYLMTWAWIMLAVSLFRPRNMVASRVLKHAGMITFMASMSVEYLPVGIKRLAAIFRTPCLSDEINLGLCFPRYSIALEESTSSCVSLVFCIMEKS